jgi:hypothetical protein
MTPTLFSLIPAVYRLRDAQMAQTMQLLTPAEQSTLATLQAAGSLTGQQQAQLASLLAKSQRGPLESLLMVIDEQLAIMAADLDQLYDDQFIETCAPWVIPYIGDLIGYQQINGINAEVDDPRSEVAETISLRRRKGTALAMEQLARDITGWGAHAVEYFQTLADTQYVKHVRAFNRYAPSVRSWKPAFYQDSGFSTLSRKVDVRAPLQPGPPRPNLANVGIYLWSLQAWPVTHGTLTAAPSTSGASCFRFSPLGVDMPLFHAAVSQGEQVTVAATEVNVPDRLGRLTLCEDLVRGVTSSYYGTGSSLAVYDITAVSSGGKAELLNPYQIQVANLSGPDGAWANAPATGSPYSILLDPELGRLAVPAPGPGEELRQFDASFCYGFNAAMGGGEYERVDTFLIQDPAKVYQFPNPTNPAMLHLADAIAYVIGELSVDGSAALEIASNSTQPYNASSTLSLSGAGNIVIDLPKGSTLEIRTQDKSRAVVLLDGELQVTGDANATLALNGILFAADSAMLAGSASAMIRIPAVRPDTTASQLASVSLTHTTLLPGWALAPGGSASDSLQPQQTAKPSVLVEAPGVALNTSLSILGPVFATALATVSLADSIVDATSRSLVAYAALDGAAGGAPLTATGCTLIGKVHAQELALISDCILWSELASADTWPSSLLADRLQAGCVRYSYLPYKPVSPRPFKCVKQAVAGAQPIFFTTQYGQPAYCKLFACTDATIRRGADDGGEMGGFHFLLAPLRETDLTLRLQEYTPVGLSVGLVYNS